MQIYVFLTFFDQRLQDFLSESDSKQTLLYDYKLKFDDPT